MFSRKNELASTCNASDAKTNTKPNFSMIFGTESDKETSRMALQRVGALSCIDRSVGR